jgi:glycosyltransferase involved in cell wall biosynthesis
MLSLVRVLLWFAGFAGALFPRHFGDNHRMLVLAPGALEASRRKGVIHQLVDFACDDYFEQVVFYHFHVREPLSEKLSDRVTVVEDGPLRYLGPLNFVRYLYNSLQLARRQKITLIRSTDPYYRGLLGAILARLLHVPFCISIHADYDKRYVLDGVQGAPEVCGSRQKAKQLESLVLAQADLVLPIRESLVPFVTEAGVAPNKILVIPHGLDLTHYANGWPAEPDVAKILGLPTERRIISFVGRLSRENYVYDLLTLAGKLSVQGDRTTLLVIAGDGPERQGLAAVIEREGLQEYVRLVGFQPADVVCALRRQSYLNLALMGGFSLIEACAAGRPVISYAVEWHYELVRDDDTGYLLPEGDIEIMSATVHRLLNDPVVADRLGKNARQLALARHERLAANRFKLAAYEKMYELGKGYR